MAFIFFCCKTALAQQVFSTWEGRELDKCASIWLIKRFIAPDAEIKFYKKGEQAMEGVPFDIPEANFRRYHNKSTYETLVLHYKLMNNRLDYIGRLVHDVEINIWEKKAIPDTYTVQSEIRGLLQDKNAADIVNECKLYFDLYYEQLGLAN